MAKMKRSLFTILLFASFFLCSCAQSIVIQDHYVNGKNVLAQKCFSKKNATYIIKRQFDLLGATVTLPAGSVLKFEGNGCLSNGTIVGDNSNVESSTKTIRFSNIIFIGVWHTPEIYSSWFKFGSNPILNTRNFRSMCNLTDNDHKGLIYVAKGTYPISLDKKNECCFNLNSNTDLVVDGIIKLEPNALKDYQIIQIKNKRNVNVSGSGTLIGDVERHTGSEGQWGMGIEILSSENVQVKNLTIKKCWGDCMYIGQSKYVRESHSKNVLIENVTCDAGRRQGLSIIAGHNITIKNSRFINTGSIKFTKPGAGIDIEPNKPNNTVVKNVVVQKCSFGGNHNDLDILTYHLDETSSVLIKNCQLQGNIKIGKYSCNVTVDACVINRVNPEISLIKNIIVKNTKLKKKYSTKAGRNIIRFENCSYD